MTTMTASKLDPVAAAATQLPSPATLHEKHPLERSAYEITQAGRQDTINIMNGADDRIMAVVGPCSMDANKVPGEDTYTAVRFVEQLQEVSVKIGHNVLVMVRCSIPKPRTDVGWRGLEQDNLVAAHDIATQIANKGALLSSEVMYPSHLAYFGSRLAMAWVGARNIEDTAIRHTLSAYSGLPVFCKNAGDGSIEPAQRAIKTINTPQQNAPVMLPNGMRGLAPMSSGNPNTALLWRAGSRYKTPETYEEGIIATAESGLAYGVDVSHGGAIAHGGKGAEGQQACLDHVLGLMAAGALLRQPSMIMIEAYLEEGADTSGETPGKSLTDPCVGINQLEDMLLQISDTHAKLQSRI